MITTLRIGWQVCFVNCTLVPEFTARGGVCANPTLTLTINDSPQHSVRPLYCFLKPPSSPPPPYSKYPHLKVCPLKVAILNLVRDSGRVVRRGPIGSQEGNTWSWEGCGRVLRGKLRLPFLEFTGLCQFSVHCWSLSRSLTSDLITDFFRDPLLSSQRDIERKCLVIYFRQMYTLIHFYLIIKKYEMYLKYGENRKECIQ